MSQYVIEVEGSVEAGWCCVIYFANPARFDDLWERPCLCEVVGTLGHDGLYRSLTRAVEYHHDPLCIATEA
jgi:hypothetical protein